MKIILLGKQGCGKGTQSKLLSKKYNLPIIATGDLLREIAKEDSEKGRMVKQILDDGKFPPNEITNKLIIDKTRSLEGFVLDGYPRNPGQAEAFKDETIDLVIVIEISTDESIKRLSSRRSCSKCGEIYNILTKAPKKENICDNCGIELTQRADDTPDSIKERLSLYENQTIPILSMYKEKGILKYTNGEKSTQEVFDDICKLIDSLN